MRVLVVDGYNIVHAWPRLKQALQRGGLEEARRRLVAELAEYAAVRPVAVTVVFDGPRRADAESVEIVDGVTVRFSGRAGSADHMIERLVGEATRQGPARDVVVATGDNLQRDLVMAMGGSVLDPRGLEAEVGGARSDTGGRAERSRDEAHFGRRLEHRLRPETRRRLEELRRGRPPEEPPAP